MVDLRTQSKIFDPAFSCHYFGQLGREIAKYVRACQRDNIEQSTSPTEVHCHSFVVPLVAKCGDEEVLLATFNANGSHELRIPLCLSGVGMSTIVDMSPVGDRTLISSSWHAI